jgi:hypothetical protein
MKQNNLFWFENCFRQSETFLFSPKTYRLKQNVLIWLTKFFFTKADLFCFCLLDEAKQFDLVWKLTQPYVSDHFYLIQKLNSLFSKKHDVKTIYSVSVTAYVYFIYKAAGIAENRDTIEMESCQEQKVDWDKNGGISGCRGLTVSTFLI